MKYYQIFFFYKFKILLKKIYDKLPILYSKPNCFFGRYNYIERNTAKLIDQLYKIISIMIIKIYQKLKSVSFFKV